MPVIDLGVNFDDVKELDEWVVVPGGTYSYSVMAIDQKNTQKGRPMLVWRLQVTDPASSRPVSVFYNTVLPFMENNEMNVKGCGMLVSVCKNLGLPWTGQSLNTEAYIGRSGNVKLKITKAAKKNAAGEYEEDPNGKERNEVEGFV